MISLLTGLLLRVCSEKARRRDPRLYSYLAIPCEATKQVRMPRSVVSELFSEPMGVPPPLHHFKRAAA
jgi:hypothetical protein